MKKEQKEMQKCVQETVEQCINRTVNGKIDILRVEIKDHNARHEADMVRILPIIEAFESTKNGGKALLWSSGFVVALGSAYLIIKQIFH